MTRFAIRAAAAAFALAVTHTARAEPPTCGAPSMVDMLRGRVIEHFKSDSKPSGVPQLDQLSAAMDKIHFPNGEFDIKVDQMLAVSRTEDVRECRALIHLVEPGRVSGDSQVFYSVARSEDGQNLVAINGEQALYQNLLRSLEANNSEVRDAVDAFRRDLYRSANSGIKEFMQANPGMNKPAPTYPPSSLEGSGNRAGRSRQLLQEPE